MLTSPPPPLFAFEMSMLARSQLDATVADLATELQSEKVRAGSRY